MTRCLRNTICDADPQQAVRRIASLAGTDVPSLTCLFVDAQYDLDGLAAEMRQQLHGPILACTTAGHQTAESGILDHGMVAAVIISEQFQVSIEPIHHVSQFGVNEAQQVATRLGLDKQPPGGSGTRFGVVLIDGLSCAEERMMALLYGASNGLPMVGGSAGDGQRFQKTFVFDGERFVSDAAVVACIDTTLPYRTFGFQNFTPLEGRFVVTKAVTDKRQILELNADVAPRVYREAIGRQELDCKIVSHHPLLLRWDGRDYARAIRAWDHDRLDLFCAIEEGMVVRIGQPTDLVGMIERQYRELRGDLKCETLVVVAFHCYQRRLEIEWAREQDRYRQVIVPHPLIGFCTYGEQYNGLHMNQTVTGFVLGM
ncbi:MAG: hypothetical protein HJJLKODD_03016 [Phycisphaerae bacterium]|nr:hypothetical protein [Phycisphaerae bacterium]